MSHRRKHVTAGLDKGLAAPSEGQYIVQAIGARGGNVVEVELPNGRRTLVMLPQRFNKKLWVKRGGYLLVEECPEAEADGSSKITGTIINVLYDAQIKQLKKMAGAWPPEFSVDIKTTAEDIVLEVSASEHCGEEIGTDALAAAAQMGANHSCEHEVGMSGHAQPTADELNNSMTTLECVADGTAALNISVSSAGTDASTQREPREAGVEGRPARAHDNSGASDSESEDDLPPLHQNTNRRVFYHEVSSDSEVEETDCGARQHK